MNCSYNTNSPKLRFVAAICVLVLLLSLVLSACNGTVKLIGISAEYTGADIAVGGKLNKDAVNVTARYSDGSSKKITDFTLSNLDSSSAGAKTVTVTYVEHNVKQTAEITVNVVSNQPTAQLQSITATYGGGDLHTGDVVDKSLVTVVATYSDGSSKSVTDFTLGSVDTSSVGDKTVTVTYSEQNTTVQNSFTVHVTGPAKATLTRITAEYTGGNLQIGAAVDANSVNVTAFYSDDTSKSVTDFVFGEMDTSTVGTKEITVYYTEQDVTQSATFSVEVVSFSLVEITAQYNGGSVALGGKLDRTQLTVTAKYSNGLTESVTDYQLETYDTSSAGEISVTVTYTLHGVTKSRTFVITVVDATLTGITVYYPEARIFVGEQIDPAKVEVTASFSDGTSARVTDFVLSYDSPHVNDNLTITVSYTLREVTQTATFTVYVSAPVTLDRIEVNYTGATLPVGMRLDKTLLTVTAYYSDDTHQIVTDYTLSGDIFDDVGEYPVTVTYTRADVTVQQTFNVTVIPPYNLVRLEAKYDGGAITVGSQPSLMHLTLTAYFSNGSTKVVNPTKHSDIDTSRVGYAEWKLTYTWYNQEQTASVMVKVEPNIERITAVYNGTVLMGEQPDRALLTVTAYFSDDTNKPVTDYECGVCNTSAAGTVRWQITFNWYGQSVETFAEVSVVAGLDRITATYDGTVAVGEQPDRAKLTVTAYYADGSSNVVTDYECDAPDTSQTGVVVWQISYTFCGTTKSTSVEITVASGSDKTVADMSIHFMELGNKSNGDSIYIKAGDTDILIDAGSSSGSITTTSKYINQYCTDNTLEYVIVTHGDTDHIAAFTGTSGGFFDLYECENIIEFARTNKDTATLREYYKRRDAEVANGAKCYKALECYNNANGAKRVYDLAPGITMEILYQKFYETQTSNENDYSVCLMFTQGDNHYLFLGDLEEAGEKSLVESNPDLPHVQLYKAGHHGSQTSASDLLMKKITPEYICISCVAGSTEYTQDIANTFPAQSFIDRIAPYTDKVFVTTQCTLKKTDAGRWNIDQVMPMNGNIVFTCINNVIEVHGSNNDTLLKDTDWFRNNRTCPQAWK